MDGFEDQLELDSSLTELRRAWVWAESVADRHSLSDELRFSIHLCMEEALANVIIHGYRSEPGHPVVIRNYITDSWLFFAIEDCAPAFAPPEDVQEPAMVDQLEPGGNGIRLLRRFAGSLTYEPLPRGNRITFGFPLQAAIAPEHPRSVLKSGTDD